LSAARNRSVIGVSDRNLTRVSCHPYDAQLNNYLVTANGQSYHKPETSAVRN